MSDTIEPLDLRIPDAQLTGLRDRLRRILVMDQPAPEEIAGATPHEQAMLDSTPGLLTDELRTCLRGPRP